MDILPKPDTTRAPQMFYGKSFTSTFVYQTPQDLHTTWGGGMVVIIIEIEFHQPEMELRIRSH